MLCFRAALLFPVALARRAWFNQSGREIGVAEARMDQLVVDPDTDAQPPEKLDAESAQPVKEGRWSRFVKHFKGAYAPDPVISFSGKPYDYTGFFRTSWTAVPLSMYHGALRISGPLYGIIKLLESRELPISCPTLWADRGFHLYLSVTKPGEKISSAITHAAVKVVTLGSLPSFLAQVLGHNAQHAQNVLESVHGTMEQSDAVYELGQEAIEEPGINATRTAFQRICTSSISPSCWSRE